MSPHINDNSVKTKGLILTHQGLGSEGELEFYRTSFLNPTTPSASPRPDTRLNSQTLGPIWRGLQFGCLKSGGAISISLLPGEFHSSMEAHLSLMSRLGSPFFL